MRLHGAPTTVHVITRATTRNNFILAVSLIAFVGSAYYMTMKKMKTTELNDLANELDGVRQAAEAAAGSAGGAVKGGSAAAAVPKPAAQTNGGEKLK